MSIAVHPELWERFPGMRILCVTGEGLDNTREYPSVEKQLEVAQSSISEVSLEHQNLQAWRDAYVTAGISMSKYPVSVLAMVKRISKGGRVPSINPLVNFYNAISIGNISPLGGMDLDFLKGAQQLRFTKEGEIFQAIGAEEGESVQAGEICYADEESVTTRHFAWRQADRGAIRPTTKRFILIAEVVPGTQEGLLEDLQAQILTGLKEHFGVEGSAEVIAE